MPLIRLGIGDVTLPLAPAVIRAMHRATERDGPSGDLRGYCEETCGAYDFLRFAIRDSYLARGTRVADDEIFVSDGTKSDCGNIGDIFHRTTWRRCAIRRTRVRGRQRHGRPGGGV